MSTSTTARPLDLSSDARRLAATGEHDARTLFAASLRNRSPEQALEHLHALADRVEQGPAPRPFKDAFAATLSALIADGFVS